jgi:RNA polymerase sigma-70 factor (ECF subfamily)
MYLEYFLPQECSRVKSEEKLPGIRGAIPPHLDREDFASRFRGPARDDGWRRNQTPIANAQESCGDDGINLMLKVAQGDGQAYEELYRRYYGRLLRFLALRVGRAQPREDLIQEVFLRVWRDRERYRPHAAFETYLFACAKNVVREYAFKARRESLLKGRISLRAPRSCLPENDAVLMSEDMVRLAQRLLAVLPNGQGRVFELVCIRGLSARTAARILRCTVHAIHTNLYRARKHLRQSVACLLANGEESRACDAQDAP